MSEAPSRSGTTPNDVERMMKELALQEDELDNVVLEQEEAPPIEGMSWMAIARVHTDKTYSQFWFYKNMRAAWVSHMKQNPSLWRTTCTLSNFPI